MGSEIRFEGQIDAIAEARIRTGKQSTDVKVVPVELKTGKWKDVVEHGAQVLLYTLMIGEIFSKSRRFSVRCIALHER